MPLLCTHAGGESRPKGRGVGDAAHATPTEDPTTDLWHPPGITVLENIEVLGSTVEELLF